MWISLLVLKMKNYYYIHEGKKQHKNPHVLAISMIFGETEFCIVRIPTSGSFLFTFLRFLPLWKFSKCFSSFLKFGNKIFNVIQNMVQNLLWEKRRITVSLLKLYWYTQEVKRTNLSDTKSSICTKFTLEHYVFRFIISFTLHNCQVLWSLDYSQNSEQLEVFKM